jgi:hypothetical protein
MPSRPHHQLAIERLARESQLPTNAVAQLYEDARAKLAVGARITSFLGIFAIRNVRKVLRQRKLQASGLAPEAHRRSPVPPR